MVKRTARTTLLGEKKHPGHGNQSWLVGNRKQTCKPMWKPFKGVAQNSRFGKDKVNPSHHQKVLDGHKWHVDFWDVWIWFWMSCQITRTFSCLLCFPCHILTLLSFHIPPFRPSNSFFHHAPSPDLLRLPAHLFPFFLDWLFRLSFPAICSACSTSACFWSKRELLLILSTSESCIWVKMCFSAEPLHWMWVQSLKVNSLHIRRPCMCFS